MLIVAIKSIMLSDIMLNVFYGEYQNNVYNAEWHYAECQN